MCIVSIYVLKLGFVVLLDVLRLIFCLNRSYLLNSTFIIDK